MLSVKDSGHQSHGQRSMTVIIARTLVVESARIVGRGYERVFVERVDPVDGIVPVVAVNDSTTFLISPVAFSQEIMVPFNPGVQTRHDDFLACNSCIPHGICPYLTDAPV